MSRLEELLLKWRDQTLTQDELNELNSALQDPRTRQHLVEWFSFDSQLLEALHALAAVEQTAQSAQQFQTLEVREAHTFPTAGKLPWVTLPVRSLARFLGLYPVRWARAIGLAGAAALVSALFLIFPSEKTVAVIDGNGAGVTVLRGSEVLAARSGLGLKLGDTVKTSGENGTWVRYLNEATQIKLQPGTQLKLEHDLNGASGKRFELIEGAITAKVAPQPPGHPMLIGTAQSEAKVVGTEFLLSVDAGSTHLEVIEGAVQLCSRDDGKAVVVNRDHFATVARGVDLAARPLLPAPWNSQDVGAVGMTGHARIEGHRCKIKGAGKADTNSKDQFHFLYQALDGDGEIRARVVDVEHTHNLAMAGVLIRDSLKPTSPHAFLYLKAGSGLEFEHRAQSDARVDWAGAEAAPYWLRLVKTGEWIRAYKSADGVAWSQVGADQIKMHGRIYFGLGVSSWNKSKLTTSVFDNVNVISTRTNTVPPNPSE